MADTNFRGPVNSMGPIEVDNGTTPTVYPTDGPSLLYQGVGLPDIRSAPFAKDGFRGGQQPAFLVTGFWTVDQIPQARNTSLIATTQVGTVSVAVSLASTQVAGVASAANIAVGVPIIPLGTTVATFAMALDFGFATGTTAANSSTVVVVDNRFFTLGQWIIIGGAGNAASTRSHIAQVASIATANLTGITIAPVAVTAVLNAPIGQANLYDSGNLPAATQFGPSAPVANAHSFGGAIQAGMSRTYNPREMLARNITLQAVTAVTYSALVTGWDMWGAPMTEVLTLTAQTSMAGSKAFKYIASIVSGTSSGTQALSFGLGDSFGLPVRCDEWEQLRVNWNGSAMVDSRGFTPAIAGPSNSTSDDVRGTVQISTAILTGVVATSFSAIASNGTGRLAIRQDVGVWNTVAGNPVNTIPMFGVAQSTTST